MKLFRSEAVNGQGQNYLGPIRVGRDVRQATVALWAATLAGALVAFAVWGEVSRKSRIPGVIVPVGGIVQLTAAQGGTVVERRRSEGEFVPAGEVVFVLRLERVGAHGETSRLVGSALAERQRTLDDEDGVRRLQARARKQALADRARSLALEAAQVELELDLAERRAALARETATRYERLAQDSFVSPVQAQAKHEELLDARGRGEALKRNLLQLRRERGVLQAELADIDRQLQADLAQLGRARAALDQDAAENEARRQLFVVAPQSGFLTALHVPVGGAAPAGAVLATFVPAADATSQPALQAELYAPSRTAGFAQPEQEVWLRYAAYPYQKFGMARGVISTVSRTPVGAQELPAGQAQALQAAAQSSEPMYRLTVALDSPSVQAFGRVHALRAGMTLEGHVVHERRAIWEWALEPLLALRHSAR